MENYTLLGPTSFKKNMSVFDKLVESVKSLKDARCRRAIFLEMACILVEYYFIEKYKIIFIGTKKRHAILQGDGVLHNSRIVTSLNKTYKVDVIYVPIDFSEQHRTAKNVICTFPFFLWYTIPESKWVIPQFLVHVNQSKFSLFTSTPNTKNPNETFETRVKQLEFICKKI